MRSVLAAISEHARLPGQRKPLAAIASLFHESTETGGRFESRGTSASMEANPESEQWLMQARWVRGLAGALVSDAAEAEDLAQDTLAAALDRGASGLDQKLSLGFLRGEAEKVVALPVGQGPGKGRGGVARWPAPSST